MKKLPIEKANKIIEDVVKDTTFLSTDEKLQVRNLQLNYINAKGQLSVAEQQLSGFITQIAKNWMLSPDEFVFDINSLTFIPRNKPQQS